MTTTVHHAPPAPDEYCALRLSCGLSPMDEEAAVDALREPDVSVGMYLTDWPTRSEL